MNFFKKKEDLKICSFDRTLTIALTHRLRTPLNGARWALESIISKAGNSEDKLIKESYNKVLESLNITSEILNIIGDNRKVELKKEKIDLCLIVDNILKSLEYLVKEKNITLGYTKCDHSTVYVDKRSIELAIMNIIDNAFRYSPNGNVYVSIDKQEKDVKLTIKDTGVGISHENLKKIFNNFFRGENAIEMEPGQSGIGLYTTQKILEINGGNIKIDSKVNEGTTVLISLPLE
jgi:signal transduction histidine kinase